MNPSSVCEVYRPAPQRSSNAIAIITSIKVSFQFCISGFLNAFHAKACSCDSFRCRSESLSRQVMTQHGKTSAQIAEGLPKGNNTVVTAI